MVHIIIKEVYKIVKPVQESQLDSDVLMLLASNCNVAGTYPPTFITTFLQCSYNKKLKKYLVTKTLKWPKW